MTQRIINIPNSMIHSFNDSSFTKSSCALSQTFWKWTICGRLKSSPNFNWIITSLKKLKAWIVSPTWSGWVSWLWIYTHMYKHVYNVLYNVLFVCVYFLFVHYILYTVHYILYNVHYILYTVHCALYTVHYILYTVHYILYTVHYIP